MRSLNRFAALLCAVSVEAAHVVTQTGRQINGSEISAEADGSVTLRTVDGQAMTFRKGQYREAVADRPSALAQAEELLKNGQGDAAIPLLRQVKSACRFLAWDRTAARLLADHYFETGRFAEAAEEYRFLDDPAAQARLREALVKSGDAAALLPELERDIATGSREAAAQAYLLRGDWKAAGGDLAGARRDWLKVATFFTAQQECVKEAEQKLGLEGEGK